MRILDHDPLVTDDPRTMSEVQLARIGVRIIDEEDLMLQCMSCGETWIPVTDEEGKLGYGYWRCPNKCNG